MAVVRNQETMDGNERRWGAHKTRQLHCSKSIGNKTGKAVAPFDIRWQIRSLSIVVAFE